MAESRLQQHLPLAVLKLIHIRRNFSSHDFLGCNNTYRLRYWNGFNFASTILEYERCNNTYRLRYWNFFNYGSFVDGEYTLQQHLPLAVLKQLLVFSPVPFFLLQ